MTRTESVGTAGTATGGDGDSAILVAISLKMYFDPVRTMNWTRQLAALARTHPAVTTGRVRLVVLPSVPVLATVLKAFEGTPVAVGAQDCFYEDRGAYTGAVSPADLSLLGCEYVEVGHAERRTLFGEDDHVIALKVAAAWRNAMTPLVCVGESEESSAEDALRECRRQLTAAITGLDPRGPRRPLTVAYEPMWAIGATQPAGAQHIATVCRALHDHLDELPPLAGSPVIYGGSAGAGLLGDITHSVSGLFLGRFAHDVVAVGSLLDEMMQPR